MCDVDWWAVGLSVAAILLSVWQWGYNVGRKA